MSGGKNYVLDANVFIEAHQKYYGFEICPGFWSALNRQFQAKRVCSIDRVRAELTLKDKLAEWATDKSPKGFFKGTADTNVVTAFTEMVNWAQNEQQFTPEAKAEFASVPDGWIIAYAKANSLVVVTHEAYAPEARNRVLMPNVCLEFDVDYCNTFEMLEDLKVQFVLRTKQRRK